jgi:hypothetical protein
MNCAAKIHCVDVLIRDNRLDFMSFECNCINNQYQHYTQNGAWPPDTTQMCIDFINCLQDQHSVSSHLMVSLAVAIGQQSPIETGDEDDSGDSDGSDKNTRDDDRDDDRDVNRDDRDAGDHDRDSNSRIGKLFVEEKASKPWRVMHAPAGKMSGKMCFEPSDTTYDALIECRCLGDLTNICGNALVTDQVACLFDHACMHQDVCPDWKAANCPYHAIASSFNESFIQERTLRHQIFLTGDKEDTASSNLPGYIDASGSSRLHDRLLDRTAAFTQNNLEIQDKHDLSEESVDGSVLGKCTTD